MRHWWFSRPVSFLSLRLSLGWPSLFFVRPSCCCCPSGTVVHTTFNSLRLSPFFSFCVVLTRRWRQVASRYNGAPAAPPNLASRVPTTKEWRCNASTGFSLSKFRLFLQNNHKPLLSRKWSCPCLSITIFTDSLPETDRERVASAAGFHAGHLCTISFNGLFSVADFLDFHSAELWYFWTSVWLFPPS